ncbi:MAG TPA: hypothetical protein VIJ16_09910 [Gemmatimonadaceae bacterium]
MTTSPETSGLNYTVLRGLIDDANQLPLADRITLFKGLVPRTASELTEREFAGLMQELLLIGERLYEALGRPGEGRLTREVPGERDLEGR